jgi:uncharacterized protein (TIGR00251 family)
MDLSPCLSQTKDGTTLVALKVQPRASRNEVCGLLGEELKVKVTAPPVDSAANQALLKFMAQGLGCARASVTLHRGQSSRHKIIAVSGLKPGEVEHRLLSFISPPSSGQAT